ncbi:MAG TPA: hypothetical protein VGZ00_02265 [Candidatus Baltobacteraceae bacterium]|nr:hypothetical protein [Candidatus Baltobacteraceae bacterium]
MPPVESVLRDVVTSLALAAHAYLEPQVGSPQDLEAARLSIDVAVFTLERISPRLSEVERDGLSRLLAELRMIHVRKRG